MAELHYIGFDHFFNGLRNSLDVLEEIKPDVVLIASSGGITNNSIDLVLDNINELESSIKHDLIPKIKENFIFYTGKNVDFEIDVYDKSSVQYMKQELLKDNRADQLCGAFIYSIESKTPLIPLDLIRFDDSDDIENSSEAIVEQSIYETSISKGELSNPIDAIERMNSIREEEYKSEDEQVVQDLCYMVDAVAKKYQGGKIALLVPGNIFDEAKSHQVVFSKSRYRVSPIENYLRCVDIIHKINYDMGTNLDNLLIM